MTRFMGSVPGSTHLENMLHEETVAIDNRQQGEAAIALCSEVKADVKNLQSEMESLKEIVAGLRENSDIEREKGKGRRQRIPAGLSKIVRNLHENVRNKFEPSEMFGSSHNQEVAAEILLQVMEHHKESFSKEAVKRAVHRYYESRRRIYNDSKPARQEKVKRNMISTRRRSFQKKLYERRAKMLKTDAERVYWKQISADYMSEESQDENNNTINHHRLTWTSKKLQKIKAVLDKRLSTRNLQSGRFSPKERVESTPSKLTLPRNPVEWAVERSSSSSQDQCDSENTPLVDVENNERADAFPDGRVTDERASHVEGFARPLRELYQTDLTTPRREVQSRRTLMIGNNNFRSLGATQQSITVNPMNSTARRPSFQQSTMSSRNTLTDTGSPSFQPSTMSSRNTSTDTGSPSFQPSTIRNSISRTNSLRPPFQQSITSINMEEIFNSDSSEEEFD